MTIETGMNRRSRFVASVLPWLLAAAMFGIYLVTLNRLVTPFSLDLVADIAGWNTNQGPVGPVTFIVTYPFRWLPASAIPVSLNIFSAALAALALAVLARSVALLPHDRTNDQRLREASDHSTLTIPAGWLPPVLAVLVCGLQMTFWQQATEFRRQTMLDTGEMLNLFLFAWVIRCLLEYRISQRESWLTQFAVVYGIAMANNWAMIGFFPLFLVAFVWIKGLDFFHWRFVLKILGLGLAGFALILLLPLFRSLSSNSTLGFWEGLHLTLASEKNMLAIFGTQLRLPILLVSVFAIFPVLLMGIRWASSFGDNNPLGAFLAMSALNIVHGFFLVGCLWVALDPPFGPRRLLPYSPFLTFLYLGALSVGYYSGYFLLVFGTRSSRTRQRPRSLERWFNRLVTAAVWLLAVAAPVVLVAKNLPQVRLYQSTVQVLNRYFTSIARMLPPQGAVLLSDNSFLIYQLKATLAQEGNHTDHLLINTAALGKDWKAIRLLAEQHPQYKLGAFVADVTATEAFDIDRVNLLETLAVDREIYYLHPSFGYYYERFYPQPRGLIYQMQPFRTNSWFMPPLSQERIAENQAFWNQTEGDLQFLVRSLQAPVEVTDPNPWQRFLKFARLTPDPDAVLAENRIAAALGQYYSRALDYWGVELKKCGRTNESDKFFELAQKLNKDNISARINLEFNHTQLEGRKPEIKSLKAFDEKLGPHLGWLQVLQECGPFDEPNFCGALGMSFAAGRNYRQAMQQFARARELAPDSPSPSVLLAWLYLYLPFAPTPLFYCYPPPETASSNALAAAEQALSASPGEPNALFFKGVSLIQLAEYEKAIPALDQLLEIQTTNYLGYLNRAIAELKLKKFDAARKDYETVGAVAPKAYQVNYGLAEIAYERKDVKAAIENYELYLTNSPPQLKGSDEVKRVEERLKQLKNGQN